MEKNPIKEISNSFSTGGGGTNFEHRVQAMFLLSLLIDGYCPAMDEPTKRVCFQAKHLGFDVDDLAVFTDRNQSEGKLLCQIKHKITATPKDNTFKDVISAAWSDFNKETFDKEHDKIALATAQISNSALRSLRFLHEQAIGSIDEQEFIDRIYASVFSNKESRKMLDTIKNYAALVHKKEPSNAEMWQFCKAFILLLFDIDCEESVNHKLSASLIKCNSTMDALLVWSRLVELAGMYDQAACSIDINNIDKETKDFFTAKHTIPLIPEPIAEVDLFIPIIATIGAWKEDNTYDCKAIEKISGMKYSKFESKARNILIQNSNYLQLVNSSWHVLHKEELLSQCKDYFFDDLIGRLFEMVKTVLSQNSKRVTSNTPYYISSENEYDNSYELRGSLVKSICWLKANLNSLPNCTHDKAEGLMTCLVSDLLKNANWTTWASLRNHLQNLAQLAPDEFLDSVEWNLLHNKQEIINLFPRKNSDILNPKNYITELLWSLEILAWSPDYLIKSICTLGLLEALPYEHTNWANTPLNSIVSILLPWYPQTLANLEKRKNALKSLRNDNQEIFWKILNKLLPNRTTSTSVNPKPKYMLLSIPDKIMPTNAEVYECYAYMLELAVEIVSKETEKQLDLVDQIGYMYEQTLSDYLKCLDNSLETYTKEFSFSLWLKLRERIALIKPNEKAIIRQRDRINQLIEKLKPDDKKLRYQELYLGNMRLFKKDHPAANWDWLESEKATAVKEIYNDFGFEETEHFGKAVKDLNDVARKLGPFLTINELSELIDACYLEKVSQEFTVSCISSFVYSNGAVSLLDSSLCEKNNDFVQQILIELPFSTQLLSVVEKSLQDKSAYWKHARMPFVCRADDVDNLKLIADNLISCKRYVTATNLVGLSDFNAAISSEYLCNLLSLAGTKKSIGNEMIDNYAVQKIIGYLQSQEGIDLVTLSNIEFIYLPVLDEDSEVQPHALYTRISTDPTYFCDLLKRCFKKHSETNREIRLSQEQSTRLFKIIFNFSVTPGVDWNGMFHADKFKLWMNTVTEWSKENDRYEVAMHTVGSGLAYAKLDDSHLPEKVIMEELNQAENGELRRGYYLGVVNQRGIHIVDPDGKQELELAEEYKDRAISAESIGYSRYADVLREVADHYSKEAAHNIASAKSMRDE